MHNHNPNRNVIRKGKIIRHVTDELLQNAKDSEHYVDLSPIATMVDDRGVVHKIDLTKEVEWLVYNKRYTISRDKGLGELEDPHV